ncbi:helix-turn-helix domain-containing protein [Streptomyces scopuliridis]|uniref:helix-turn-helix domain-containing protein n=1 Tax=Streptomyces scopuliridis TaxID=452529 RepID=UPI0036A85D59
MVHAFNERGVYALVPKWNGERPRAISERVREYVRLIALGRPPVGWRTTDVTTWSLARLAGRLIDRLVVPRMSRGTLRRILREGKVS